MHLVVILSSGLISEDVYYLQDRLEECIEDGTVYIPTSVMYKMKEGVERCGQIICKEIQPLINKATHLSFISIGVAGLFCRYLLGIADLTDTLLEHYISFNTYHFGYATPPIIRFLSDQTSKDAILEERRKKRQLIQTLLEDRFFVPFSSFKSRISYKSNRPLRAKSANPTESKENRRKSLPFLPSSSPPKPQLFKKDMTMDPESYEDTIIDKLHTITWIKKSLPHMRDGFWISQEGRPIIHEIIYYLSHDAESKKFHVAKNHLVVLIHGLDGYDTDMSYIATKLTSQYPNVRPLASDCNHDRTHDGIVNGSLRILQAVIQTINTFKDTVDRIIYISVIGHSLGGLYGRCLIGLMLQHDIIPNIIPLNYISLATPHLGSREHSKYLGDKVTSYILGTVIGLTGKELFLGDNGAEKMLVTLSKGYYRDALKLFQKRILYSNTRYDTSVHYSTAALRQSGFLNNGSRVWQNGMIINDDFEEEKTKVKGHVEELEMLNNLTELGWTRYAVIPIRILLAHIDIISKSLFFQINENCGWPVIAHLVDHFRNHDSVTENIHLVVCCGIEDLALEDVRKRFPRPSNRVINLKDVSLGRLQIEIKHSQCNSVSFICFGTFGVEVLNLLIDTPLDLRLTNFVAIESNFGLGTDLEKVGFERMIVYGTRSDQLLTDTIPLDVGPGLRIRRLKCEDKINRFMITKRSGVLVWHLTEQML